MLLLLFSSVSCYHSAIFFMLWFVFHAFYINENHSSLGRCWFFFSSFWVKWFSVDPISLGISFLFQELIFRQHNTHCSIVIQTTEYNRLSVSSEIFRINTLTRALILITLCLRSYFFPSSLVSCWMMIFCCVTNYHFHRKLYL